MGKSARTANPVQTTPFFEVNRGYRGEGFEEWKPLPDCSGNWDHLNLIFPVYLKLMTGFPSYQPEDIGVELIH
jgi:hypothetical protein